MVTRVITGKQMAEALLDNTKALRSSLEKYVHFVPISYGVISELVYMLEEDEKRNIFNQVYSYFTQAFPLAESIDISNIASIITNNKVKRLSGKRAVGVYQGLTLVGVLTSDFGNASSLVVNAIQKIVGINLAVGHVVGDIEVISSKSVGGHVWIKNNLAFRSPLSMKLALIQEIYGLAEHVRESQFDTIINWYFNPLEGTTRFIPKHNFTVLNESLKAAGPKVFSGDLGKQEALEKGISKSSIITGLKTFYTTHFKSIKGKVEKGMESSALQVTNSINNAITTLAREHQAYLDRVVDQAVITKDFKRQLAQLKIIFVLPQTQDFNSKYLAPIEKKISKEALNFGEKKALDYTSSPSLRQYLEDIIVDEILGTKKTKDFKQNSSAVEGAAVALTQRKLAIRGAKQKTSKKNKTARSPLRNPSTGKFTSIASIQSLIQLALYETIKKNMVDPALNFRSGRFAGSVQLQNISQDRAGGLTAFLTYMKYPYGTFEPGFAQGSVDRSPTLLIDRSVREIALKLVTARMKTVII